jgi:hypothetical protein
MRNFLIKYGSILLIIFLVTTLIGNVVSARMIDATTKQQVYSARISLFSKTQDLETCFKLNNLDKNIERLCFVKISDVSNAADNLQTPYRSIYSSTRLVLISTLIYLEALKTANWEDLNIKAAYILGIKNQFTSKEKFLAALRDNYQQLIDRAVLDLNLNDF